MPSFSFEGTLTRATAAAVFVAAASATSPGPSLRAQGRLLPINAIQGTGSRSPVEGQTIITRGIVTARKTNGFFIQSPDGGEDADTRTSEGIFVFTSTAPAANLTAGTIVSVTGRVLEFVPAADPLSPPLTEIEAPVIEVRGAGAPLPAAIEVRAGDAAPGSGHEQLERLEGMRVRIPSLMLVSGTLGTVSEPNATGSSNGVFYGVIAGVPRPFREPGIDIRTPLPAGAPCCVPRFDGNPERIRVDSDGQPGAAALNLPAGTLVQNLVGPLDYGFQSYTVLPDPATPPTVVQPAVAAPVRASADGELAIASFNLQRLFDTVEDPLVQDVVLTAAAFQTRLAKASLYIRQLLHTPDIVGVQEVENLQTLAALAGVLNRDAVQAGAPDPRYEAYLEEGNDPGGIDVGVLVKGARLQVVRVAQEGKADTFRNPINGRAELLNDRPPIVITVRAHDGSSADPGVTVIVNHLRSLIDIESATDGARVRAKRAGQAEFLAALVNRRIADDPRELVVVAGDMNAFEFNDGYVDVIGTIRGAPAPPEQVVLETRDLVDPNLASLAELRPAEARYSYVFDGTAQVLDHILVSESARPLVTLFAHVRGNADSPEVWRSDARRPERVSDHDPALTYLAWRARGSRD